MNLTDILKEVGNDDIKLQFLSNSTVAVKDKKKTNDTEVTFATDRVNSNEVFNGYPNKVGIVVWVDRLVWDSAIECLNNKTPLVGLEK